MIPTRKVYGMVFSFIIISSLFFIFNFEPTSATANNEAYTLVDQWGGFDDPKGIAVYDSALDAFDAVYVTDSNNHCFQKVLH